MVSGGGKGMKNRLGDILGNLKRRKAVGYIRGRRERGAERDKRYALEFRKDWVLYLSTLENHRDSFCVRRGSGLRNSHDLLY
jgi:hypothetical protein